jgi:hypothetical protein
MLILDATTKTIDAVLAGAVATTQLPIVASFVDVTTTTYVPASTDGVTNSTTQVAAVAAPAAATQRQIKELSFCNVDTAAVTVTVSFNNNGTRRTLRKVTLAIGSTLVYTDGEGWRVMDVNGNILGTSGTSSGGSGAFTVISNTATGAVNDWAPAGMSGNTMIEWNGVSDFAPTGLAGGVAGQIIIFKNNTAAKIATFANLVTSAAGNQFTNYVTSAPTPVAAGGSITFQHDGTNWKIVGHEQGAWITPAYLSTDFTGQAAMTWTVDAGDVIVYRYRLAGRMLMVSWVLRTTSVGGTLNKALIIKVPGGFAIANQATNGYMYNDNAGGYLFSGAWCDSGTPTAINLYTVGFGTVNWSASTHLTHVYGSIPIEVT